MKVLHLLQSNRFSGAENVVCQIISMMKDNANIDMAYCSRNGEIQYALQERNITFFPIESLSVSEIKRVIKEYNPDIIHAHDMKASFFASVVCGKRKLVSHIHNSDFKARRVSVKSCLYLFAMRKIQSIIWVSKSCFETFYFRDRVKNKSITLYNIIDVKGVRNKADTDVNEYDYDVVYVGRLVAAKNPLRLIEVLHRAIDKNPNLKVAIVGSGDLEKLTKNKVDEYGLSSNITFLGYLSNPYKILASAKVMVMTSDREGLPMVALEAMSLGVPIVSTPTDGMCDLIEDGKDGYLCKLDDVLVDRILELTSDLDKQKEISKFAINKAVLINDIERYKNTILTIYGI